MNEPGAMLVFVFLQRSYYFVHNFLFFSFPPGLNEISI